MGSETLTRVALFPLSVVLFPQGVLPLRVFEARYMDMVRDCMRDDSSFGVCLVSEGKAASANGVPATADVGCLARITAWDMQQLGLLQIRTVGGNRFRLLASESQPNGLMIGEIDLIEADEDQQVPDAHRPCVELLTRIIEDMSAQLAEKRRTGETIEGSPVLAQLPFEEPFQMDSSAWVSNRLCEVLPVPLKAKQKLMELTDAATRLEIVHTYLKQHSVLK
jgi:Lon protease-like protein